MVRTRNAKIRAWFFAICVICIVGGALGVFLFSGPADNAPLLLVSSLALLAGVFGFLAYLFVHLLRKGVEPPTEQQKEVQRQVGEAIGRAAAHAFLGKFLPPSADGSKAPRMVKVVLAGLVGAVVGGSAAAGIAAWIGEPGGVVYWILVGVGVIIGVGYGVWAFWEGTREAARSEVRSQGGEVSREEFISPPEVKN